MTRTILVTGGAGYIGSQLIRDLATDSHFTDCIIRIFDNMQRENYSGLWDLPIQGRYEFIEGDILDNIGLRMALQDVWAVVHMAAVVRTPLAFGPIGWMEQVNHWGTSNLVEAAIDAGVAFFVFTSSSSVYGPVNQSMQGKPHREIDVCRPIGLYAESKLRAEKYMNQSSGRLKLAILRLGNVFGLAPAARFDAVTNRLAYLAGTHRALTVYGDGMQTRPLLHVQDASSAVRFALTHTDEMAGETFNVLAENASVNKIVEAIRAVMPQVKVHHTEQDILVHLSYAADSSTLDNLGWYPAVSLEAGLSDMLTHLTI